MASSLEPSLSALTTTPIKNHLHSLSDTPTVATPDPSHVRNVKPEHITSDSGSDLPKLTCGVASKRLSFLPQKYEMLREFFNAMVSSIRLFRLKRLSSTFTQLSRNIESLTKRRFTIHHLAQLKHIVPEVIVVKKIRVLDWETKCMKEDFLVSLEVDAVATDEDMNGSGGFSQFKGIFQSRLADYFKTHDEDEDVPEAELPKLFYQPKQEPEPSMCITPSSSVVLSHIAPSFKKRFSSRAPGASVSESSQAELSSRSTDSPMKEAVASIAEANAPPIIRCGSTPAKLVSTPAKLVSTPAKISSTPERLMAATPTLLPPKRPLMTPDHDCSRDVPNRSAKRRALNFECSSNDIDDQPNQVCEEGATLPAQDSNDHPQLFAEKEHKISEQDPIVSQEKSGEQVVAEVINLFDMIHHLFQSIRRSAITKEELIYKLITAHLDIIDRMEVEKQLELLHELAPEYISEVQSISGDSLLRLNKFSCPESMRNKLLEAKWSS